MVNLSPRQPCQNLYNRSTSGLKFRDEFASFSTTRAHRLQRKVVIDAEAQRVSLPVKSIIETPPLLPFSCDEQVHAVAVGELVRLRLGRFLLHRGVREFHDDNFLSRFGPDCQLPS